MLLVVVLSWKVVLSCILCLDQNRELRVLRAVLGVRGCTFERNHFSLNELHRRARTENAWIQYAWIRYVFYVFIRLIITAAEGIVAEGVV